MLDVGQKVAMLSTECRPAVQSELLDREPPRVVLRQEPIDVRADAWHCPDHSSLWRETEEIDLGRIDVAQRAFERRARQLTPRPHGPASVRATGGALGGVQMVVDRSEQFAGRTLVVGLGRDPRRDAGKLLDSREQLLTPSR
jgi:hypothetical protein